MKYLLTIVYNIFINIIILTEKKGQYFTYKIEKKDIYQEKIKEKYKNSLIRKEIKKLCLSFIEYVKKDRVNTKSENLLTLNNERMIL